MVVVNMGNRVYRPHHARFAAMAMRARLNKENSSHIPEEQLVKLFSKCLYNAGERGSFVSLADFNRTGQPKRVEVGLWLDHAALRLERDPVSGLSGLSFTCDFKAAGTVSVFYFVKELVDARTQGQYLALDKEKSPPPVNIPVAAGQNQEVLSAAVLDLARTTEKDMQFEDNCTFPVVVLLRSAQESLMVYCKIENGAVVKVREVYGVGEKNFEVLELYGSEGADCAVCLAAGAEKVLVPCRHVCVCQECYGKVVKRDQKCPICRSFIRGGFSLRG
jgi:hypothetical protein